MALNQHDQEIVDLYHEGSTDEPAPRLDAAILSAARDALAASPTPSAAQRKTGWWKRFSVPAQFAVSFMLVAMLSVLLTRERWMFHRCRMAKKQKLSSPPIALLIQCSRSAPDGIGCAACGIFAGQAARAKRIDR